MFHPRKYAVALAGAEGSLIHLCATRLSLVEAVAWLQVAPPGPVARRPALHPAAPALAGGSCGRSPGRSGPQARVKGEDQRTPALESAVDFAIWQCRLEFCRAGVRNFCPAQRP